MIDAAVNVSDGNCCTCVNWNAKVDGYCSRCVRRALRQVCKNECFSRCIKQAPRQLCTTSAKAGVSGR